MKKLNKTEKMALLVASLYLFILFYVTIKVF